MVRYQGLGDSYKLSNGHEMPTKKTAPASCSRVLVVEDHDDTREMLKTVLEMNGFVVCEAIDGESAVRTAVAEQPDIILMDVSLPVMDGVSVARSIRSQPIIGQVPIILLSGWNEPARQREAFSAGCTDYLIKPVDPDHLVTTIRSWLEPQGESGSRRVAAGTK